MEPARSSTVLHREVVTPVRTEHGFGILLVTSVAMFFAVMSSAFIFQVRAARSCVGAALSASPDMATDMTGDAAGRTVDTRALELYESANAPHRDITLRPARALDTPSENPCGRPLYRENADGSVSVFFEVCPEDLVLEMAEQSQLEPFDSAQRARVDGIEVRRIVR